MSKCRYGAGGYYARCDVCRSETTYKNIIHEDPIFICSSCAMDYETCDICNKHHTKKNTITVHNNHFLGYVCHDCVIKNEKIISFVLKIGGDEQILNKIESVLKPANDSDDSYDSSV